MVSASGEGLGIVANGKMTSFIIHAPGAAARDLEVKVTGRSKNSMLYFFMHGAYLM